MDAYNGCSTLEVDVNGVKYFRLADTTPTKFT